MKSPSAFQHAGRVGRFCAYTFVPLIILGAIGVGITYVKLRHGPIAFDVLVPPIERGINAELQSNQVKIAGAELRLGEQGGLEFRLRDITILEKDGDAVASAPLAAVTISTQALWRARVVPERVELIDPEISLSYTEKAGLVLNVPDAVADAAKVGSENVASTTSDKPKRDETVVARTQGGSENRSALNLAKMLSDASERARNRVGATSYLTEFGLRNATVVLDYAGNRGTWNVSEAVVDFNHGKKRSVVSGHARVNGSGGPWTVTFLTDEAAKSDRVEVKATVRDLVPASLASAAPPLAMLKPLNVPLAGDATISLTKEGEVAGMEVALEVGSGRLELPDLAKPMGLTGGLFRATFEGQSKTWTLAPSPVKWAGGSLMLTGTMRDTSEPAANLPEWQLALKGQNGTLEAPEFGVAPLTLDDWLVDAKIVPRRGEVIVEKFRMAGGGGEVNLTGQSVAGPDGLSTRADVKISPMDLATLKAMWPVPIAPGGRGWVGESVSKATFLGGTLQYASGRRADPASPFPADGREHVSGSFEVRDATWVPLPGMPTITAPRGLIQIVNNALEITIPDAAVVLSETRKLPLKSGRVYSPDVIPPRPDGEISLIAVGDLSPFLETIEKLPIRVVREAAPFPQAGDGKVEAKINIKLPLVSSVGEDEVKIEGKATITDGKFGQVGGLYDVQGFTLALDLTTESLTANGDLLVNGVAAKLSGQRVFASDPTAQPPIKITATLDETDRKQLGLDINDIVKGAVPVELTVEKGNRPEPAIRVKADLTPAEIVLAPIGWRKAPGRTAGVETDVVSGKTHKTELQNFKVSGEDIALEGWLGIGADSKLKEFQFPTVALNVVSKLDVRGTRSADNTWAIKASGPTFDGRGMFRSMFNIGDEGDGKSDAAAASNVNATIDIGTVLGAGDVALRGFKMRVSKRAGKLAALDARGTLNDGAPLAAIFDQSNGQRRLLVDTVDAGQAMRLIDFYPNMQGGRLKLEVNLDGKDAADKTGILWVDQFRVLGDPIVSEVVGSADESRPAIDGRRVQRQVFEFDQLRAPFSAGYGQFVLEDAYLKGPLVGATLRGKVDFKSRKVNIGGTYVPLQGLNGAFGSIPVIGQLLSGAQGEGIFGMTFAVQGPLNEPQVLVNPLSLVAPGIFRDIFQMTSSNQKIQARDSKGPNSPVTERVRNSAAPADVEKKQKPGKTVAADGWSSTTSPSKKAPSAGKTPDGWSSNTITSTP